LKKGLYKVISANHGKLGKFQLDKVNSCAASCTFIRYQDLMLARSTVEMLSADTRALLTQLDFNEAARSWPRNLPIGRMMHAATKFLA